MGYTNVRNGFKLVRIVILSRGYQSSMGDVNGHLILTLHDVHDSRRNETK